MVSPGPLGAHNWQPMSYSPQTGLVYIPGQESVGVYYPDPNFKFTPGYWNTSVTVGRRPPLAEGQAPAPRPSAIKEPEGADQQPKATGRFLLAWDPVAEKERWRIVDNGPAIRAAYGASIGGGTLATAGNLVFQGATAYNAQTGEKLWQSDLGGVNVTPVTFMLDGKQYVSLLGGPVTTSHLFTFVLDGKAPMPGTAVSANAPANADPKTLVARVCSRCHSLEVVTNSKMDRNTWTNTVNTMVSRGAAANAAEIGIIADYLARTYPLQ